MASHRKHVHHGAPGAIVAAVTVAAVASAVAVGPRPAAELLAAVYGVGGSNDKTAANIPAKLNGEMIGSDDRFVPIGYSAGIPVDPSVDEAIPLLRFALASQPEDETGVVIGYSEGAVVAEHVRRNLQADPDAPDPEHLRFVLIAGPTVPNGGIYARFPHGIIPGFTSTGPSAPTAYDTTYVTMEYDPISDFPAYFNPLSIANSLMAFLVTHPDPSYNAADINPHPPLTQVVENSEFGTDTYIFIPVEHLQLLWPARAVSEALGTTPLTEPVLGLVEPTLRVAVDMGYTDRENANPDEHVPFSLITPPEKVEEAVAALPDAIDEGRENFQDGVEALVQTDQQQRRRDTRPGIRLLQVLRGDQDSGDGDDDGGSPTERGPSDSDEPTDDTEPESQFAADEAGVSPSSGVRPDSDDGAT